MSDTTVNELGPAYVRYERVVSPKQYEKATASVSLPVDIDNPERTLSGSALGLVAFGLGQAKQLAEQAVGIDAAAPVLEVNGVRQEQAQAAAQAAAANPSPEGQALAAAITTAFPNTTIEPAPAAPQAPPAPAAPAGTWRVHGGTSRTAPIRCPRCGGEMWDNSVDKHKPNSPDAKCKDKSCVDDKGFVTSYWFPKEK